MSGRRGASASPAAMGVGILLAASAIWGTTGVAQELADVAAEPAEVGATRLVVGATALAAFALATGRRRAMIGTLTGPRWRWTFAAGAATAAYQAAFFSAIDQIGVALTAAVALGSAPVFCGLLAHRLLGERVPRSWSAATACAIVGCTLLLLPAGSSGPSAAGVSLALVAGVCYGIYTVCAKHLLDERADAICVLATTLSVGAALSVPTFSRGAPAFTDADGVLLSAWLGLVATAGAYLLFARGLARVAASTAGTLSLAEPLTAAVLGALVLAERPSPVSLLGAGVLGLGLVLTALNRELRSTSPPTPAAHPA